MKILVAEDDRVSRLIVSRMLEKLGHEVVGASDGEEAWAVWQRERLTLVVSDWMMPRMSGVDLCRRMRTREAGTGAYTYFLLLTARADRTSYLDGMRTGADGFLTKPLDVAQLEACVAAGGAGPGGVQAARAVRRVTAHLCVLP